MLVLGEQGLDDGAVAVVVHSDRPVGGERGGAVETRRSKSVGWEGMTPFLFVPSGLMEKLPHDLAVKMSASSSVDIVASLLNC